MNVYTFSADSIHGETKPLSDYSGKVLLIVNTASKCGFTPQYGELQSLYERYRSRGFEILGFPCNQFAGQEPGTEEEIRDFCTIQYGVSFPMFAKIDVRGPRTHPLFAYLTSRTRGVWSKEIKWNFTKFLVNRQGDEALRADDLPEEAGTRYSSTIDDLGVCPTD